MGADGLASGRQQPCSSAGSTWLEAYSWGLGDRDRLSSAGGGGRLLGRRS